jgi:hypothetical protein
MFKAAVTVSSRQARFLLTLMHFPIWFPNCYDDEKCGDYRKENLEINN